MRYRMNHNKHWDKLDNSQLMSLRESGKTFGQIGREMNRTAKACNVQASKLRKSRKAKQPVIHVELAPRFFAINSRKFRRFDDRDALAAFIADHPDYTPAKAMPVKMVPQIVG